MKKIAFINLLLAFLCNYSIYAQEQINYYDSKWKRTTPEAACFISIIKKEDTLWHRQDYFAANKQLQEDAYYKDAEMKIKHGQDIVYHPNGALSVLAFYNNNYRQGPYMQYYPNYMMMDSSNYKKGILVNLCSKWYPSGNPKLEMRLDSIGEGKGVIVGWFDNEQVSFKGKLNSGFRKEGPWTYYHENGNTASVLIYPKVSDTLLDQKILLKYDRIEDFAFDSASTYASKVCYDENGLEQQGCLIDFVEAKYNKKENNWSKYVETRAYSIINSFRFEGNPIIYKLYFTIGTNGEANSVMINNHSLKDLDREILNIVRLSNKWQPAMHNNRKMPVDMRQPIVIAPIAN